MAKEKVHLNCFFLKVVGLQIVVTTVHHRKAQETLCSTTNRAAVADRKLTHKLLQNIFATKTYFNLTFTS